ncbi:MAG: CheR family methyltransferase [archaeon]
MDPEIYLNLLSEISKSIEVQFSQYKEPLIREALKKRIRNLKFKSDRQYLNYLKNHEDEVKRFLDNITVNYSYFFRNKSIYRLLEKYIKTFFNKQSIKIWSCPCASGEEPYSLAILIENMKENGVKIPDYTIIASDINKDAIQAAKTGIFDAYALNETSAKIREKFFQKISENPKKYMINDTIKKHVEFIQEDIIQGHKYFLKYDIILCRNFIIYLNEQSRQNLLKRLEYHLDDQGILILGKTEKINKGVTHFNALDLRNRFYCKKKCKAKFSGFFKRKKQKEKICPDSLLRNRKKKMTEDNEKREEIKTNSSMDLKKKKKKKRLELDDACQKKSIDTPKSELNREENTIKPIKQIISSKETNEKIYKEDNDSIKSRTRRNKREELSQRELNEKSIKDIKRELELERYRLIRERVRFQKKSIDLEKKRLELERKIKNFEDVVLEIEKKKTWIKEEKRKLMKERERFSRKKKKFLETYQINKKILQKEFDNEKIDLNIKELPKKLTDREINKHEDFITLSLGDFTIFKDQGREEKNPKKISIFNFGTTYVLILFDLNNRIYTISHILKSHPSNEIGKPHQFASTTLDFLIPKLKKKGANVKNLQAVLFGGSQIFKKRYNSIINTFEILKRKLKAKGIPIKFSNIGGDELRSMILDLHNDQILVKKQSYHNFYILSLKN